MSLNRDCFTCASLCVLCAPLRARIAVADTYLAVLRRSLIFYPPPPNPMILLFPKEESGGNRHTRAHARTHTQNMGSQPAEIIHLDICACVLLEGEIAEREREKWIEEGWDMKGKMMDSRKHRAIIYSTCVCVCACACILNVCVRLSIRVRLWERERNDSYVCLALCD